MTCSKIKIISRTLLFMVASGLTLILCWRMERNRLFWKNNHSVALAGAWHCLRGGSKSGKVGKSVRDQQDRNIRYSFWKTKRKRERGQRRWGGKWDKQTDEEGAEVNGSAGLAQGLASALESLSLCSDMWFHGHSHTASWRCVPSCRVSICTPNVQSGMFLPGPKTKEWSDRERDNDNKWLRSQRTKQSSSMFLISRFLNSYLSEVAGWELYSKQSAINFSLSSNHQMKSRNALFRSQVTFWLSSFFSSPLCLSLPICVFVCACVRVRVRVFNAEEQKVSAGLACVGGLQDLPWK